MESKTKHQKKRNYGFYVALSLCLIAVGVAAWSAVDAFNDYKNTEEPKAPQNEIIVTPEEPEEPAQNELPKVEYEEPEASETKPEPTPQPQIPTAEHFILPIENGNIIKKFDGSALQYSATLGDMRLHEGVDIGAAEGSAVRSAGTGTVTEIYCDAGLGFIIVIDHGNKILAKYCGLGEEIPVKVGDVVSAGTAIGTLGLVPVESADDPHLHLEVYKNGKAENPLKIMGMEE